MIDETHDPARASWVEFREWPRDGPDTKFAIWHF